MNRNHATAQTILNRGLAAVLVGAAVGTTAGIHYTTDTPPSVTSGPVGPVRQLLDDHHCWTGPAPVGAVAHRAVVTLAGADRPQLVAGRRFDAAIAEGVYGQDSPRILVVHGFCP